MIQTTPTEARKFRRPLAQRFPGLHPQGVHNPLCPGQEFERSWHIEAIAYLLEQVRRGEIRRLIINMPPRSLKSIAASVAFPAFVLGLDPTRRFICVSYSGDSPKSIPMTSAPWSKSPWYRSAFPDHADRAIQELGDRDRIHLARLPAGDIGRGHIDRSRRRHHRHRRSPQARRRLLRGQAQCRQRMVQEHLAFSSRRQAHGRDRHRHAARPYG